VRRLLDLDADLNPFLAMARTDPLLGPLVRRRPGVRRPLIPDPFEGLMRAVVGQQVSVPAASTLLGRIVARFGVRLLPPAGDELRAFPEPARIAEAGSTRLAEIGLPRARAAALAALGAAAAGGALDWDRLRGLRAEDADRALTEFPGIGPWTAAYLRLRVLGDPDAFPASDLGVIRALERLGVARRAIERRAERWRPWRAYATLHLWASLRD
jgi:3-methyladenine DNA glycosylase/8-oxoguanine DNA glycosylase